MNQRFAASELQRRRAVVQEQPRQRNRARQMLVRSTRNSVFRVSSSSSLPLSA